MNLTQFLKRVDADASNMTQEQLVIFLHNIARTLPENQRIGFLSKLNNVSGSIDTKIIVSEVEQRNTSELLSNLKKIKQDLALIENGELYLVGNLNEEYDDWYNSEEDEFIFEDPKGVLKIIENACKMVHQCVDYELLKEGYELANILLTIAISVEGDYSDYTDETLYMADLEREGLITYNFRRLVLDALYAAYQSNPLKRRPEILYHIICNSECDDITLESMIQEGNEDLKQQEEFLNVWIGFLGEQIGREAERLMQEAVMLKNNFVQSLEYARKFSAYHPGIYEQIMLQIAAEGKDKEVFEVGQEALHNIPKQYLVRSRVALLTAGASLHLERQEEAELYWLEAFQSETKPIHFIRLICESYDSSKYRECAKKIYHLEFEKMKKDKDNRYQSGELRENKMDSQSYYMIAFLDGEFQHVIMNGMNVKDALGWSSTFMKTGIALFLLYLYQGEDLPRGCTKMCENIVHSIGFTVDEYSKGLSYAFDLNDVELFWNLYGKWKNSNVLPEADQEQIINKLDKWIQMRVEGIMQNNRRNYYGECAAFVAALGEVKDSRGERNGKDNIFEAYRTKYSRRSAFHDEMRAYGMKDRKRT
jgi:hypothetical protein